MSDLAFLDPSMACSSCGHPADFHRTENGACTYEILDYDAAWIRCDCWAWK
jgi:uncharacterized protein (DUF983 family)